MDYSNFYHNWLQLDVEQNVEPNFYEILGLSNLEPDVQKINAALNGTLDRFQNAHEEEQPEAYRYILQLIFSARRTLLDPQKKLEYDFTLSTVTGQRVWRTYQRPSLLERLRQMGLITVSLVLGSVVMAVMAVSVERNPDGSIIFHEEVKVAKAEPFTTPLDYVVYRPSIASDFQPNGYVVATENRDVSGNGNGKEKKEKEEPGQNAQTTSVDTQDDFAELIPNETEQNTLLPDNRTGVADSKPATTEEELNEFADILSEDSAVQESEKSAKQPRSNPLYGRETQSTVDTPSESEVKNEESSDSQEEFKIESEKEVQEIQEVPAENTQKLIPMPPITENLNVPAFSLTAVMDLLENVRKNMDFKTSGAEEAFTLLQFQTFNEVLPKLNASEEKFDQEESKKFITYMLQTITDLGWEKHFEEAFLLCGLAEEFGKKNDIFEEIHEAINVKRTAVSNYQNLFVNAQQVLKELEAKPDDPALNTHYAMWLWQENGDLTASIPYLAKCQYSVIRRAANLEMMLEKDKQKSTPQTVTQLADYWWEVADRLKDEQQINLVQEHAKLFYRQVEPDFLNDTQKRRIANK